MFVFKAQSRNRITSNSVSSNFAEKLKKLGKTGKFLPRDERVTLEDNFASHDRQKHIASSPYLNKRQKMERGADLLNVRPAMTAAASWRIYLNRPGQ